VSSECPLLGRAGKDEGARKQTRLASSFPNAGKSFLAFKRHLAKVLVTMEEYLPLVSVILFHLGGETKQEKHTIMAGKVHSSVLVVCIILGTLGLATETVDYFRDLCK